MENNSNSQYKIILYNLPNDYIEIIKIYFNNLNSILKDFFEIIELNTLENNNELINQSNVLLIDVNNPIIRQIKKYLLNKNKENFLGILIKLINFINLKDEYTKLHSENVANYAVLLGKELNLPKKDLELIKIGGMLHDIGKIGIPYYILNKKGCLTSSEYEIIKRHTIIGESLLPRDGYEEIKQMIRSHHERFDGKGYPDGLKGSDIPYFARILSIADTFDAMTTQRTYNEIRTLQEAINELYKCSRKELNQYGQIVQQLDPNLVDIFIKAIKNNKILMQQFIKKDDEIINNRNKKQMVKRK